MNMAIPKQYLPIFGKTVLEHTLEKLLAFSFIQKIIVPVSADDRYFATLPISRHEKVLRVNGGKDRVDSVLSALEVLSDDLDGWVLVHDAARPCVSEKDISTLVEKVLNSGTGGILASPVRDTMKRGDSNGFISETVSRENLWHALTPQMFTVSDLLSTLKKAKQAGLTITDEASAMEWAGKKPLLVTGRSDNIKITQAEDILLAEFYLSKEEKKEKQ